MSPGRRLRRWIRRARDLAVRETGAAARRVLSALPLAVLSAAARALAVARLAHPGHRRSACEHVELALSRRPEEAQRLTTEAARWQALAALATWHSRSGTLARLRAQLDADVQPSERPAPLLLTARYGGSTLARALLALRPAPWADLDALPERADDAAWLPWLGRLTAVDLAPLEAARAQRRGVRLLLVLPQERGWTVWWSPDLAAGGDAAAVAERALRVLEVLVRAAPHLWDWSYRRWGLRPERAALGHARSSRLAPWLNPRRRAGRRGRRGR